MDYPSSVLSINNPIESLYINHLSPSLPAMMVGVSPKMAAFCISVITPIIFLFCSVAADPDPLQDVCVADYTSEVKVNGYACKPTFNEMDFFTDALSKPGPTNNSLNVVLSSANVLRIPGLNTLGLSLTRIDYAPGGINPPHSHPRATEMVFVLEGQLDVGFITTSNVLVSKSIKKGEVFVFPKALVHFQMNNGKEPAIGINAFNSQFPGSQVLADTLFASTPTVPNNVLAKAFQVETKEIEKIKYKLAPKK
ncbi:hypothetical protein SAY86_027118 [Trapa natans]|uniref:Germin-like protein n=1 Tax=Trapa natans TaxID=22666 RepID=A0AAN7KQM6_TRANT|nr:hypothetical protein SAY86_027118 [Trapa natans]